MIARVSGTLAERDGETIVVETEAGVGYEMTVPIPTLERMPPTGGRVSFYTQLVVKEDGWSLFGFDSATERQVFRRLLTASGFGPRLALSLLSALGPGRTVRSIQGRDLAALSSVSGIGRKKAERLVLELSDRFEDVRVETTASRSPTADDAVRALTGLGYPITAAEDAVRAAAGVTAEAAEDTPVLIRRALQHLAAARGGR